MQTFYDGDYAKFFVALGTTRLIFFPCCFLFFVFFNFFVQPELLIALKRTASSVDMLAFTAEKCELELTDNC